MKPTSLDLDNMFFLQVDSSSRFIVFFWFALDVLQGLEWRNFIQLLLVCWKVNKVVVEESKHVGTGMREYHEINLSIEIPYMFSNKNSKQKTYTWRPHLHSVVGPVGCRFIARRHPLHMVWMILKS